MLNNLNIALFLLFIINLVTFLMMNLDKQKSKQEGRERTPEGLMFFWSLACGAIGVYLGMLIFRHKTKKWYFRLGIPLAIIQNIALLMVIYYFISN